MFVSWNPQQGYFLTFFYFRIHKQITKSVAYREGKQSKRPSPPPPPSLPSLNSGCQIFQRVPFGITFRHPFTADQPQLFSKSAYGANITNFEGERTMKKRNFFCQNLLKWPVFGRIYEKKI